MMANKRKRDKSREKGGGRAVYAVYALPQEEDWVEKGEGNTSSKGSLLPKPRPRPGIDLEKVGDKRGLPTYCRMTRRGRQGCRKGQTTVHTAISD